MKYLTYIENIIFNDCPIQEQEKFQTEILIKPDLKEDYETYIEALEFVRSMEISLPADAIKLRDFEIDPEIASMVSDYLSGKNYSDSYQELSKEIREITNSRENKMKKMPRGWFKAAAIFVLLLTVSISTGLFHKRDKTITIDIIELGAPSYNPYVVRGRPDSDESYIKAINYYYRGYPDSAMTLLNAINDSDISTQKDQMLESVCLMELNRPKEAIILLQKVDSTALDYTSALWHIAICNIMIGEKEKTKEILNKLRKIDPVYNDGAYKLTKLINKRHTINIVYNPVNLQSSLRSPDGIFISRGHNRLLKLKD